MKNEITLGVKAKDIITGFTGIVTARTAYLTGCDRISLTPESSKGEIKDSCSFDITSCVYVGPGVAKHFEQPKTVEPKAKTGGPEIFKTKRLY